MTVVVPEDIVAQLAAAARTAQRDHEGPAAASIARQQERDVDAAARASLAVALLSFARGLDAAVPLPADGLEIWSQPGMRGDDSLRVRPGGRLVFVARRGPRPARIDVADARAVADAFSVDLLRSWVDHVGGDAVWQHVRARG